MKNKIYLIILLLLSLLILDIQFISAQNIPVPINGNYKAVSLDTYLY